MGYLRKTIFWAHLFTGVIAGIVIATMCFTGVALAFEKEIVAWFDRGPRLVSPQPGQGKLTIDQLLEKAKESKPDARIANVVIQNKSDEAILLSASKTENYYANPHTGEIKPQAANRSRKLMEWMVNCHRWLGAEGDSRPIGKAITGACNLAFLFLAISGLYLWFPRKGSWAAFRAVMTLNPKLRGKARDWNWHNAIGFWSAPILIVLTLTASVISYRWASDMVYKVTGATPPPAPNSPPAAGTAPATALTRPSPDAKPLPLETLIAAAQKEFPGWDQISYRPAAPRRAEGGVPPATKKETQGAMAAGESGRAKGGGGAPEMGEKKKNAAESPKGSQPIVIGVRDAELNPEFTVTQVSFNPYTGDIIKKEGYGDYNTGRKVRTWMRFLHTGEALGVVGKAVAGAASGLGLFLVYTGFSLSLRRLRGQKPGVSAATPVSQQGDQNLETDKV